MGRRTWQALPDKVRPLPGRRKVVLSRRSGWRAPGATVVDSLDAALEATSGDVWVIGGAEVYRAALERADRAEITELEHCVDGDVFAPRLAPQGGSLWACQAARGGSAAADSVSVVGPLFGSR